MMITFAALVTGLTTVACLDLVEFEEQEDLLAISVMSTGALISVLQLAAF